MSKTIIASFFCLGMVFGTTMAGVETQTLQQDWTLGDEPTAFEFQPFDTMGGIRSLVSASIHFDGQLAMEFVVENFDPVHYAANTWAMDGRQTVLFSFQETESYPDGGPFFFLGGIDALGVTGELSPGAGGPFGGTPGELVATGSATGSIASTLDIDGSDLDYFHSDVTLHGISSPFVDFVLSAPTHDAFISARVVEQSQVGSISLTYRFDLLCDLDFNETCDIDDLNALTTSIAENGSHDLNSDGASDLVDRDLWLESAARWNGFDEPFSLGDANLDGSVERLDLNQVGIHWLEETPKWSHGDFDASGNVDPQDLNLLAVRWQTSIAQATSVPEPSTFWGIAWGLLALFRPKNPSRIHRIR